MFWRIVAGITRTAISINRTVTALGIATIIGVGVYDFLKTRRRPEE